MFFFQQKAMKKHFLIFWKEHKVFGTQKWSSHKVEKNRHFAKGLVHGFCQKINLFLICFFWAKKSRKKHFFYILDRKECFLDYKREVLKNFHKSTFWKRVSPWFFLKNGRFPNLFFWAKKARKKHFFYILGSKECFLDLKSEVLAK